MNEAFIGFVIWVLTIYFLIFNPSSSFGKKVIFCSWILGPCRILCLLIMSLPLFSFLSGITALGTVSAVLVAYFYGEQVIDKFNPNASRFKYIAIGFLSSLIVPSLITSLFA